MKTKQLISALAVAILSFSSALAQRVETALVDGRPVINCSGMPAAAITTTSKGNTEAQLKTAAANATVFHRFAVAIADNSTSSNWSNAFTVCSNLGAGWRLPTQRELMLMWVLKAELEKTSGFTKFNANHYWSATEANSNTSWYVYFYNGYTYLTNSKTTTSRVRCVREF